MPGEFKLISHEARRAFHEQIMPYIQDLNIFTMKELNSVYKYFMDKVLPESLSQKDQNTYHRLITYKSVDMSEEQFWEDIATVLTNWYERAKQRMEKQNGRIPAFT